MTSSESSLTHEEFKKEGLMLINSCGAAIQSRATRRERVEFRVLMVNEELMRGRITPRASTGW